MMRSRLALAVVVIVLTPVPSLPQLQETVVFRGDPFTRALSRIDEDLRDNEAGLAPELVITNCNGEYFWTNQDDEPLLHFEDGPHHLFISQSGNYIKILDTEADGAEQLPVPEGSPRFLFMSHRTEGIDVLTTWGFGEQITILTDVRM